ncbi:hypothetical protein MHI39_24120 [Heyndrickxia sp. FSL K6-6286]|uniref:hypothetical protein n=1 Tax=Heyndrickxia sp. FSL K6-6286 TaxID=2921510 RepID=UPI00315AE950
MFRIKKIMPLVILMFIFLTGCSTKTALASDEEITNLVNNYLEALESRDISSMVKYADDIRFPDKDEQKEQYSSIDGDITDTKLIELQKVNETEFEVTVELVDNGELVNLKFPVKKQKKGWKVIVGQDT